MESYWHWLSPEDLEQVGSGSVKLGELLANEFIEFLDFLELEAHLFARTIHQNRKKTRRNREGMKEALL